MTVDDKRVDGSTTFIGNQRLDVALIVIISVDEDRWMAYLFCLWIG